LLNAAIDRLARAGGLSDAPGEVARSLDEADLREAALIHLSALLEAEPTNVRSDGVSIGGIALGLVASRDPSATLFYEDLATGFLVQGADLERRDGPTTMAALLELLQYARDRSDTLLYLPTDHRKERIARLVERTGASERFVRFILARYHTLSSKVAA
jgi:hypothetical protein